MSNEVWAKWKSPTSGEWLFDRVRGLTDAADISDLRRAFVEQRGDSLKGIDPAAVVVRKTENSEMLKASTKLTNYFVPTVDSAAAAGPGRSEDTALFLTLPQQGEKNWALFSNEAIATWRNFETADADELRNLPSAPFRVSSDDRVRYELQNKLVKRTCFADFEAKLLTASQSAIEGKKDPAMSVLGAKGAGKSVFFRYFVYKHCTNHLTVYVPNAGTDLTEIYRKLMDGLIFGLQCCNHKDVPRMLQENVLRQPRSGTLALFRTHWSNWSKLYDLCGNAFFIIDQLQREGELFSSLSGEVIPCAGYVLISSTGILHHHNVSSVYKKLSYFYPVSPDELAEIDEENKLDDSGRQIATMLGAICIIEGHNVQDVYVNAARKHYNTARRNGLLPMLLAVMQSQAINEAIDGGIWEDVLDPNYFWVDEAKMVQVVDDGYAEELRALLKRDKVNYKQVLISLLSDQQIVNGVGNAALGVHVEALLDIVWQELKQISWVRERRLGGPKANRSSCSQGSKKIRETKGQTLTDIQPVSFDGDIPSQDDLRALDWNKPVYFKPKTTNYAGFDMFVVVKFNARYSVFAIQITVKNAKDHDVDAFDSSLYEAWNGLLHPHLKSAPEWRFYMLTPENDPGPLLPASAFDCIPVFQIGYQDLEPTGNLPCGIKTVFDFADLLDLKRQAKKQKK